MRQLKVKEWKGFHKGINLGGWFSQSPMKKEHFDSFITSADLDVIAGWGLDHVRLPIDFELVVDMSGNFKESGFAYLKKAVDDCIERGLNVIINIHKADGYAFYELNQPESFFESEVLQEKFYELWEEIARRFGSYNEKVAFELLSDVTSMTYSATWNSIIKHSISRIRRYAKENVIMFGGCNYNSCASIPDLPDINDSAIAYTFHFNAPLVFTHQGAHWLKNMPEDFRYDYTHTYQEYYDKTVELLKRPTGFLEIDVDMGKTLDSEYYRQRFENAVETAVRRDKYLYCGEYGVIKNADPYEACKWFRDVHEVFEEYGISRAAWTYKEMDFDISGEHFRPVIDEIVRNL